MKMWKEKLKKETKKRKKKSRINLTAVPKSIMIYVRVGEI